MQINMTTNQRIWLSDSWSHVGKVSLPAITFTGRTEGERLSYLMKPLLPIYEAQKMYFSSTLQWKLSWQERDILMRDNFTPHLGFSDSCSNEPKEFKSPQESHAVERESSEALGPGRGGTCFQEEGSHCMTTYYWPTGQTAAKVLVGRTTWEAVCLVTYFSCPPLFKSKPHVGTSKMDLGSLDLICSSFQRGHIE